MNKTSILVIIVLLCITFCVSPAFAQHSGLTGASGECIFSQDFIRDYESAQKMVDKSRNAEPLLKLLKKYRKTEEQAELQLSLGLVYNQRTGVVDPSKAVTHLSNALKYRLPEKTYVQIFMLRGNSLETLKKHDEALKDYLRGLLACSYHALSGGWPEISPKVFLRMGSDDPKDIQRAWDYRMYRERIDFQRFLIMQRHYFIEAVKRIQSHSTVDDDKLLKFLEELSPDISRFASIMKLLKSENKRPWP